MTGSPSAFAESLLTLGRAGFVVQPTRKSDKSEVKDTNAFPLSPMILSTCSAQLSTMVSSIAEVQPLGGDAALRNVSTERLSARLGISLSVVQGCYRPGFIPRSFRIA